MRENLDAEGRSKPLTTDFENAVRTLGGDVDDPDLRNAEMLPTDDGSSDEPPKDNGDVSTPQWLFDYCNELAIKACGEPITLDVAAADWNHKCERYFTEADDGLTQAWDAKADWCNPPYSPTIIESFVRKALAATKHGTTTMCLIPSWNYPYLDLCERYGQIHRICNPLVFRRQDGSTTTLNNGFHSSSLVIVVFGPTIQPGFGLPIRKGDTPKDDLTTIKKAIANIVTNQLWGLHTVSIQTPDAQGSTTLTTGWFVWERGYKGEPALHWIGESQTDIRHRPEPPLAHCDTAAITNGENKRLSALRMFVEAISQSGQTQQHVRWLWETGMGFPAQQFDTCLALLPESHRALWESLAKQSV